MITAVNLKPVIFICATYYVSNLGDVYQIGVNGQYVLTPKRKNQSGYLTVRLFSQGMDCTAFVHRLVAQCFVENSFGKAFVNHKNGKKEDNRAENLEWVTHAENLLHAYRNGLVNQERKERPVVDQDTGTIFKSAKDAARHLGIPYSTFKNYLNGNRPNRTNFCYLKRKMEAA